MLAHQYKTLTTQMQAKDGKGYKQDGSAYAQAYNKGLDEEARILCFLNRLPGMAVMATDDLEDQLNDIDCYINGIATSIKAEHTGLAYGHIYFEMATQRYQAWVWEEKEKETMNTLSEKFFLKKRNDKPYKPGWFFKGKAEQYLILQGENLYLIKKADIAEMIQAGQVARLLGLSAKTLLQQGNKDTICAFLDVDKVPKLQTWNLPNPTARNKPLKTA